MGPYFVLRKISNIENANPAPVQSETGLDKAAPARLSVAATIIRGSSQRRRARANGLDHPTRHAAVHAKRRNQIRSPPIQIAFPQSLPDPKGDVEMKDAPRQTISAVLPRRLDRPRFQRITPAKVAAIEPQLAELPIEYIQDKLAELGPDMIKVLAGVEAYPPANAIPRELDILVNDLSSDMPTHMFAVYTRERGARRHRVIMFPTHSIVWAANCASLPILPPSHPQPPSAPLEPITIPVVPLVMPDPASFAQLSSYIYTKRADSLLSSLLPSPPVGLHGGAKTALLEYALSLAQTQTRDELIALMLKVRGMWLNMCALGIFDDGMWAMLDLAWEVYLNALALSAGKPLVDVSERVPRAQL